MIRFISSLLAALFAASAAAAGPGPVFSTTIDFLDCAFGDRLDVNRQYYPLEVYEARIREWATSGIKKLYLRVNVCGLTHYPSRVSARYGTDGAFHWKLESGALRLIETYKHYDPAAETIRLGHKYGMEVWAWESLYDDAGEPCSFNDCPEKFREFHRRLDGWMLLDPFYRANPDAFAERDPLTVLPAAEIAAINREARRAPIVKAVFTNDPEFRGAPACALTAADIRIFTAGEDGKWREYTTPFEFTADRTSDGRNRITVDKLQITDSRVKLLCRKKETAASIVIGRQRGQGVLYNSRGEIVRSVWTWAPANSELLFDRPLRGAAAWDYNFRQLGFLVGEIAPQRYAMGVAEFNVPKAMEHKVARFAELAKYPFDGFMFNIRSHSSPGEPDEYGYNPEVLAKFTAETGRVYSGSAADRAEIFRLRGEAVAEFFRRCKAASGGRPIYLSGPKNPGEKRSYYGRTFGSLPWLYRRYFSDRSIDGVIMIGDDFPGFFTPEVTGGNPVKLGVFREMYDYHSQPARRTAIIADLEALKKRTDLDEVELYESIILSHYPELLDAIR